MRGFWALRTEKLKIDFLLYQISRPLLDFRKDTAQILPQNPQGYQLHPAEKQYSYHDRSVPADWVAPHQFLVGNPERKYKSK